MKQKLVFFLCLFLFTLYISALVVNSRNEMTEPFIYQTIGYLEFSIDEQKLLPINEVNPALNYEIGKYPPIGDIKPALEFKGNFHIAENLSGFTMMMVTLNKVLDIPLEEIQFWPIGGILIFLAYFVLCRALFNSNLLAFLPTILLSFSISMNPAAYTVYVQAWGMFLLFLFILFYIKFLKDKKITQLIVLALFFLAAHFYYYNIEAWMIAIVVCASLVQILFRYTTGAAVKPPMKLIIGMALALIVFFFVFNRVFYTDFLPNLDFSTFFESRLAYFTKLVNSLLGKVAVAAEPYAYTGQNTITRLWTWLAAPMYLILVVPTGVSLIVDIINIIRKRLRNIDEFYYIKWFLVGAGMVLFVVYSSYGEAGGYGWIVFFCPITSIISFKHLAPSGKFDHAKLGRLIFLYLLVLVSINFPRAILYSYNAGIGVHATAVTYENIKPSAKWFAERAPMRAKDTTGPVLGDLMIQDKLLVKMSQCQIILSRRFFTPFFYEILVDPYYAQHKRNDLKAAFEYIVIDKKSADKNMGVYTMDWKTLEPLSHYYTEINGNVNALKVYDDGTIWFLRAR